MSVFIKYLLHWKVSKTSAKICYGSITGNLNCELLKKKIMLFHVLLHSILNKKNVLLFKDCIQMLAWVRTWSYSKSGSSYWWTASFQYFSKLVYMCECFCMSSETNYHFLLDCYVLWTFQEHTDPTLSVKRKFHFLC